MVKVRSKELPILTRAGVVIQPHQEVELKIDEAYDLKVKGLVEILSGAPPIENMVRFPSERRLHLVKR
jgi:hypothetical protein